MKWWITWLFVVTDYYLEFAWALFKEFVSGRFAAYPKVRPMSDKWMTGLSIGKHEHVIADHHLGQTGLS